MPLVSRRFKTNMVESRFTPIVFAVIVITIRLGMMLSVSMDQSQYPTSFIWNIIFPIFSNNWISFAASTASIFVIAFIISQLNLSFSLIRFRTTLPFSMALLFLSIHPIFLTMSPNYLSVIFILLAFFPLLQSYQHPTPHNFAFKSGVLLALAATFQVYTLLFLPLWFYGEISMHGFRTKSFLAFVIGVILVFWNVSGFYFLFDDIQSFLVHFTYFQNVNLTIPTFNLIQWCGIGLFTMLLGIYLLLDYNVFRRERVLTQKALSFIILIIIWSVILHFIYFRQTDSFLFLILTMMSFVIAHYYSHVKSKWQVYSFSLLLISLFLLYINYLLGNYFILFK